MFKDAGPNIRIYCDDQSKTLKVARNILPSQFIPQYEIVAEFTSPEDWYSSLYAKQVPDTENDIRWFWIDMTSNKE